MSEERRRDVLKDGLESIEDFSNRVLRRPLRSYQIEVARAIVNSVRWHRGLTFAVMMSRQAGKNETAAQVEAFLLNMHRRRGGFIVKAAPTFSPQALNSILRLQGLLDRTNLGSSLREEGYMVRWGQARALFYSGAPGANVVGATADILLEGDEAQDLDEETWNKCFRPMAASTNATTVLWGTAWTATTLLARTIRALRAEEARDGIRRVFIVPWQRVAAEVPPYGDYVRGEIARLGADHPLIRTQYALEELQAEGGLLPLAVQRLMQGVHLRQRAPTPGAAYALLVDVGGGAEEPILPGDMERRDAALRHDATALTVVQIVPTAGPLPRYAIVDRALWVGAGQEELLGALTRLAELWGAGRVVVDATGLGAPLCQALRRVLGARVRPFVFTAASKSALGWGFLALCHAGRLLDYAEDGGPERAQFWREVAAAECQVVDGPNRLLRWGVRHPDVHDDLLISAALCAELEREQGGSALPAQVIEAGDPLAERREE